MVVAHPHLKVANPKPLEKRVRLGNTQLSCQALESEHGADQKGQSQ